jgi:hypothetical protein
VPLFPPPRARRVPFDNEPANCNVLVTFQDADRIRRPWARTAPMPTSSSTHTRRTHRASGRAWAERATLEWARALPLLVAAVLGVSCRVSAVEPPDAAASPQANAEPAPLANVSTAAGGATTSAPGPDAGPPPEPLRGDRAVSPDTPRETVHELGSKEPRTDWRELGGYTLQAVMHAGEGPAAPRGAEVNVNAIDAARRKLEARMVIEASQTRARFVLWGGFILPQGTELRARADRYGHFLLLPGEGTYRVAEEGSLRALFGERRLDVAPLSPAEVRSPGDGARRLNLRTRRVDVTTRAARATLELATLRDSGDGGALVCRMLLDLIGAPPSTAACANDEVPLHADLRWTTQGSLAFDVTSLTPSAHLPAQDLAAPPATATFEAEPFGGPPGELLLPKGELTAFRNAPVDVPAISARHAQAPPPDAGLLLVNAGDELRLVWLDGAPVAWVGPGASVLLTALLRGRYTLQWRTFLGDAWDAPEQVIAPGQSITGRDAAGR